MADYVVAHLADMLTLHGTESGLRQARKHVGWYLGRHAPDVPADLRARVMTSLDPAAVAVLLRRAFQPDTLRAAA